VPVPATPAPAPVPPPHWAAAYFATVEWLAIAAVGAVTLVAGLQVFYRYVLSDSLAWSEELMRYLMIWTAYLCAGLAYSRGEMLGMRFLVDACPPPVRAVIDGIGRALVVALLVTITGYGWQFSVRTSAEVATALPLSMFWIHLAVPVGAALLAVHVLFTGFFRAEAASRGPASHVAPGGDEPPQGRA